MKHLSFGFDTFGVDRSSKRVLTTAPALHCTLYLCPKRVVHFKNTKSNVVTTT